MVAFNKVQRLGFTLLELIVVISVLVALGGITIPYVLNLIDQSKASAIVQVYRTLQEAVEKYRTDILLGDASTSKTDTETLPQESTLIIGNYKDSHQLYYHPSSTSPWSKGWYGPYITAPMNTNSNPFGGQVMMLYQDWDSGDPWIPMGLAALAGNSPELSGDQLILFFTDIPENIAQEVDNVTDHGFENLDALLQALGYDPTYWRTWGRVRWNASLSINGTSYNNVLYFLMVDLDGQ